MPMKSIKLGKSYGGPYAISSSPSMPEPPEEYFPELRLELPEGASLPESGVLTIRYRTSREVEDHKQEMCCYDLEITEILDVKGDAAKDEYSGDLLDKLRSEVEGGE